MLLFYVVLPPIGGEAGESETRALQGYVDRDKEQARRREGEIDMT